MDDKLELVVKQLKKKSNTAVYNALVIIRTKYIKEENGIARFRLCGGIQLLLYHIQKPNDKIVELTLSILGNCCMEQETRCVVRRSDGIPHIVKILESLDKESILNRVCRTLANLALDYQNADAILKGQATKLIIDHLSSAKDSHFMQSAVRALRIFASKPSHRDKVNELGGTDCLFKLLIAQHNDASLLDCILRALASLTTSCSTECARQMQNVEYLEKLVQCTVDTASSFQETSLHVIANLSRQETLRPALGSAGIVPVLVKRVAEWDKTPGWQWAVDALCQCTREAVNRVRVRDEDGLEHFISLLKEKEDERLWLCSLSSVINFLYDETSLNALVDLGLVSTLVDRFNTLVSSETRIEHNLDSYELSAFDLCENGKDCEAALMACSHAVSEQKNCVMNMSSQSVTSPHTYCFSPGCSPPYWTSFPSVSSIRMSPGPASPRLDFLPEQSHPLDGFCYSPVYEWSDSDDESNSAGDSRSSKDTISSRDLDSPSISMLTKNDNNDELKDGYDSDKELFKTNTIGRSPLGDILHLFSRLSWQENPGATFVKDGVFEALLDYVVDVEHPHARAKRCLSRIVRNSLCFEILVLRHIPARLQKSLIESPHAPARCSACSALTTFGDSLMTDLQLQAESAFGCGIILHLLLGKTCTEQKVAAVLAASFLLRSHDIRKKVFVDSSGLSVLMDSIKPCNREEYFDEALDGLSHLAKSLLTVQPMEETDVIKGNNVSLCSYDLKLKTTGNTIYLCVEKESVGIAVEKAVLSENCDVFRAMLHGNFSESRQEKVLIRDASYKAVEYMVHYLHFCRPCLCPVLFLASSSIILLLEVLVLADKFLLTQLKECIAEIIMKGQLQLSNSEYIQTLSCSKIHDCHQLKHWVFCRLLTTFDDSAEDRHRRFCEILSSDDQFLQECQDLLIDKILCRV